MKPETPNPPAGLAGGIGILPRVQRTRPALNQQVRSPLSAMKVLSLLSLALLLFAGCHAHSQCRRDLYQSYYGSATDAFLTLKSIDQGKMEKAHQIAMSALDVRLSQLHELEGTTSKEDHERQARLTRSILRYFTEHQAQLLQDEWSLRAVTQLQGLLTEPADVQRASAIAIFLSTSTTNQLPP